MKSTDVFLAELSEMDVRLWCEGDSLRFNAPKGTLTPALRAELVTRKAEILAFLSRTSSDPTSNGAAIRPISRAGNLPLSFAQQRLWFFDQLTPASSAYNVGGSYHIRGPLDLAALEQSLNEIMRRHEVLRTTFDVRDGEPVQIIAASQTLPLPIVDLRSHPTEQRLSESLRLIAEEAGAPFDLKAGPLVRALLLCLDDGEHGDAEHILVLTMHHIVSDGWSRGVFFRELAALYEAYAEGRPSPLPALPIQYADFAAWQRESLQGETLAQELAYWTQHLDQLPTLDLPADHPRRPAQTYLGGCHTLSLPQPLYRALRDLSRCEETTLFMTLLAALEVLLHRYSGQEDFAVGCPVANRNRIEIEHLIGFFVNTLVVRADLSGGPTFRDVLARVREVTLEAQTHQDVPFETLVAELQPTRDLSRNPLVQVMFAFQNVPRAAYVLAGLDVRPMDVEADTVRFDLECYVWEQPGELRTTWVYATDLFEPETIVRMMGHFVTLLEAIVADPYERVAALPLLTEAERRRIVVEWNDTQTDYPRAACIHELVEAQVERAPDAVAVVYGERQLTYRQLNERANRLARHLRTLGVGSEVPVALCVDRSPDMVVGMLGILKAGGAYVPLDITYPPERLAYMLGDARAPVLLTMERFSNAFSLAESPRVNVVCLDRDWPHLARNGAENLGCETGSGSPACIIYTSGSTGQPKGVVLCHQAVSRLVCNTNYLHLAAGDHVAQVSTATFDAATFEIWGALTHGARLVGFSTDIVLSPADFATQLAQQRIDVLFLTTALFNQLAATQPGAFRTVRDLMFGGERADPRWVKEALEKGRPKRLLHFYGPAENTTFTTWYHVTDVGEGATTVPIGRAVSNTRVYVLDRNMQPTPVGVPGELYTGGDGLARGYLHRPDLTATSFVPDPLSAEPGARLYRTGDMVRYLPGGDIEFFGRNDDQVKLRGFRIELGEIEGVLGQHPAVENALVLVREDLPVTDRPVDRRLVAYVVPKPGATISARELRGLVEGKLPAYMVPSAVVLLDALPLTPGGKVDRAALPAPRAAQEFAASEPASPQGAVEGRLASIWATLLGVERVGLQANFFELGGHSLLAIRLFGQIEEVFGAKLPVSTIFRCPTVEELAGAIRESDSAAQSAWPSIAPLQPDGDRPPFFLVHTLGGNVTTYAELARLLGPDQPVYGLLANGLDGAEEPDARIEDMAAHSVEAMRAVQSAGPYYLGGYCSAGVVAYEIARQLQARGERVGLLAVFDAVVPRRSRRARLWHPGGAISFVRNLPGWLRNNVPGRYDRVLKRVLIRSRVAATSAWRRWVRGLREPEALVTVREFLGDASVPLRYRHIMDVHFQAAQRYEPQPYAGRVTLFRAQALPLLYPHDSGLGWRQLAAGGVEVRIVAGAHDNLLHKPQVADLAAQLKACLEQAQAAESGQQAH